MKRSRWLHGQLCRSVIGKVYFVMGEESVFSLRLPALQQSTTAQFLISPGKAFSRIPQNHPKKEKQQLILFLLPPPRPQCIGRFKQVRLRCARSLLMGGGGGWGVRAGGDTKVEPSVTSHLSYSSVLALLSSALSPVSVSFSVKDDFSCVAS